MTTAAPPLTQELAALVRERAPQLGVRRVVDVERFPGGLSCESYRVAVVTDAGPATWVLRREPAVGIIEPYDIGREHDLLAALSAEGLPVPRPILLDLTDDLGTRFMLMEYVEGEIYQANDPRLADPMALDDVTSQFVATLASIHLAPVPDALPPPPPGTSFAEAEVAACRARLAQVELLPHPGLRHALATLARRAPADTDPLVVLHGDYRLPNIKWQAGRLVGVLDWERARRGDPLADVAFSQTIGAGACMIAGDAAARYTALSGIELDEERLAYFRLLEIVRALIVGVSAAWAVSRGASDLRLLSVAAGAMGGEAVCGALEAHLDAIGGTR